MDKIEVGDVVVWNLDENGMPWFREIYGTGPWICTHKLGRYGGWVHVEPIGITLPGFYLRRDNFLTAVRRAKASHGK